MQCPWASRPTQLGTHGPQGKVRVSRMSSPPGKRELAPFNPHRARVPACDGEQPREIGRASHPLQTTWDWTASTKAPRNSCTALTCKKCCCVLQNCALEKGKHSCCQTAPFRAPLSGPPAHAWVGAISLCSSWVLLSQALSFSATAAIDARHHQACTYFSA